MHEELTTVEQLTVAAIAAYDTFVAADNAWSKELERLFGDDAGDVRYTEQGHRSPTLAPLYAAFRRANDAWFIASQQQREEALRVSLLMNEGA